MLVALLFGGGNADSVTSVASRPVNRNKQRSESHSAVCLLEKVFFSLELLADHTAAVTEDVHTC